METGFVFSPADHELTDLYLGGQIAGHPVFSTFIHHADVYSAAPAELVAGREHVRDRDGNDACYLISRVRYASKKKKKMKLRTIDDDPSKSYWHSESGKKPVEGSAVGGYVQDFVYAIKKDGHVERLGWRMKEYGISSTEHGDGDLVLCKVYRTPRKPSTTPATSLLCDVTADTCKKRKAASSHPEDTTASARPLHTVENDEHPQPVQSPDLSDDLIMFDDGDHRGHTDSGVEIISDAVPPPSNFLCNTEQEVLSLYQNDVVTEPPCAPTAPAASNLSFDDVGQEFWGFMAGPGGYLAAPPCPPAAQPEEHAAGLVQTVTSDHRMDATSVEEEGAQPEPEFIYGLPSCPALSPELIRRCSDDMMMPWPLSPTSTAMFWS